MIGGLVRQPKCAFRPIASRLQVVRRSQQVLARADKDDGRGTNTGEFCSLDPDGKPSKEKSLMEKEADFLEALQAYYYDEKGTMTDEEFENLKEDLVWSGSQVAVLSSTEQRFLEATLAFSRGNPILSDDEYDELKAELKTQDSMVALAGPRCSIRSKKMYSDATPDYLKLTLLNVPAALIVLGAVFSVDDLTGFEITKAIELPPPYSILFLWGLVFPAIYVLASSITNIVLPDALILKAPCPSCGTETQAYFGGIFNVEGNRKISGIECPNCKADLEFNALKRQVVVVKSSEEKQAIAAEKAAKKAANAAKKAAKLKKAAEAEAAGKS